MYKNDIISIQFLIVRDRLIRYIYIQITQNFVKNLFIIELAFIQVDLNEKLIKYKFLCYILHIFYV